MSGDPRLAPLLDALALSGDRASVSLVRGPDVRLAEVLAALRAMGGPGPVCVPDVGGLGAVPPGSLVLGEEHPDTRVTRFNLVLTLLQMSDGAAARALVDALGTIEAQPEEILAATDRQIRRHLPALRVALAGWPSVGHMSTSSDAG